MSVASSRASKDALLSAWPVLLVRAAHPVHALVAALLLGSAATFSGRPGREALLVALTVLVGQAVMGWHNDVVDRTATPATTVPASRWPRARSTSGASGSPSRAACCCWSRSRSAAG